MEHFKKFLVRLQTFNARVLTKKKYDASTREHIDARFYDLTHENPVMTPSFKNEMKELSEMAIMDVLNLSPSQITYQLRRLESIKEKFEKFWNNYYKSPVSWSDKERISFFYELRLGDIFMVEGMNPGVYTIIFPQQFIDDIYDSVIYREEYLKEFEKAVAQVLSPDKKEPVSSAPINTETLGGIPAIKENAVPELFAILKDYFALKEREDLQTLLQTGRSDTALFTFNGNGNQLADAFKQLYDTNLIVGCSRSTLEHWLRRHFAYTDKDKVKRFTGKYLNDIISSDTRNCQSPILDVKKNRENGQFEIFPVERTKRNSKKY
jgi:hypothetical protein